MFSTVAIINAQRTSPDSRRGLLGSCWTYIHMYQCPMRPYNFKYKVRIPTPRHAEAGPTKVKV